MHGSKTASYARTIADRSSADLLLAGCRPHWVPTSPSRKLANIRTHSLSCYIASGTALQAKPADASAQ